MMQVTQSGISGLHGVLKRTQNSGVIVRYFFRVATRLVQACTELQKYDIHLLFIFKFSMDSAATARPIGQTGHSPNL